MRVVVEKVGQEPTHALTSKDVKALIRAAEVHLGPFPGLLVQLKATLPENTVFERPVIYSPVSNRLNVLCRGLEWGTAVREVLRELVVMAASIQTRQGHRLSAQELREVDARVGELLPKVIESIGERTT